MNNLFPKQDIVAGIVDNVENSSFRVFQVIVDKSGFFDLSTVAPLSTIHLYSIKNLPYEEMALIYKSY